MITNLDEFAAANDGDFTDRYVCDDCGNDFRAISTEFTICKCGSDNLHIPHIDPETGRVHLTKNVPAWLNLDEIVPLELRSELAELDASAEVLCSKAAEFFENGNGARFHRIEAAAWSADVDPVENFGEYISERIGLSEIVDRIRIAVWMLEDLIGGSPTTECMERIADDPRTDPTYKALLEPELARLRESQERREANVAAIVAKREARIG